MPQKRFKLPAAVFLILQRDDRVLLLRRRNTGWHDGDYDLIAGHIDGRESLSSALAREAKEEMDIELEPGDTRFVHIVHALFEDGLEYINVFFTADRWSGEPKIIEPDKCSAFDWFPLDKLPANLTPTTKIGLKAFADSSPYSEYGFGPRRV